MKKFTIITISLLFLIISTANAQLQTVDGISSKYQEIDKGDGYKSEMVHPGGYCSMVVEVKEKGGDIAMIKLSFENAYGGYEYEYYYQNDEVFYIHTKSCSVLEPTDDGVGRSDCFEYMHFFNVEGWLYSRYIQGEYKLDGNNDIISDIGFSDNEKAFLEYDRATNYLKAAKTDDWSAICD
jgi:hypothetical protein